MKRRQRRPEGCIYRRGEDLLAQVDRWPGGDSLPLVGVLCDPLDSPVQDTEAVLGRAVREPVGVSRVRLLLAAPPVPPGRLQLQQRREAPLRLATSTAGAPSSTIRPLSRTITRSASTAVASR